jgi:hypothetical protein
VSVDRCLRVGPVSAGRAARRARLLTLRCFAADVSCSRVHTSPSWGGRRASRAGWGAALKLRTRSRFFESPSPHPARPALTPASPPSPSRGGMTRVRGRRIDLNLSRGITARATRLHRARQRRLRRRRAAAPDRRRHR